jgi:hypothetical protein
MVISESLEKKQKEFFPKLFNIRISNWGQFNSHAYDSGRRDSGKVNIHKGMTEGINRGSITGRTQRRGRGKLEL